MLRNFDIPISWTELLKRTAKETSEDNVAGLAAQLAYYFFLALFPALLFLIALASYVPYDVINNLIASLATFAPPEIVTLLRQQLDEIARGEHGGLLTIGILGTIWSSSAAIVGIIDALNRAYDIEEGRPWWKVRLTAIGLTIALAAFIILAFSLVLLGPTIAEWLAARLGFGAVFEWTWKVLQWPLVFFLVAFAIGCINYFAPDAEQDWEWITPGAVVATGLWLLASLAFKFYVANFGNYNETYGTVGGVIILMLWFYISAFAILIGSELNAEIEHASPYGKAPGEKVPGQKRKIGAAARRAYDEAQRRAPTPAGRPRPAPSAPVPAPARPAPAWRTAVLALAFLIARKVASARRQRTTAAS
jgi:membrane protein